MNFLQILKTKKSNKPKMIFVDSVSTKKQSVVLPFIMQFFLLYTCLTGFIYCITTSLQTEISFLVVAAVCLPFLLVTALLTLNTKLYIVFLSLFGTFVACIFVFFKDFAAHIMEAFEFGYNRVIQIVVDEGFTNYKSSMTGEITDILSNSNLMNGYFYTILLVLTVLFSVIFTVSMMKKSMVWLCTLPCFLVLTPSLYFGAVPSGAAFAVFISGIIGCYVQSLSSSTFKFPKLSKKEKKEKNKKIKPLVKSSAICGFANTMVVLVVSLTVSVFVYSSDLLKLDNFRKVIDDIAMHIMNVLFYEQFETAEGRIGGLIEDETLELSVPEFRDLPVMDVTTRTNGPLYLRGWIGKNLDENGWKVLNETDTEKFNSSVSADFQPYTQFYNFMTLMSTNELENAETEKDTQKLGFVYDTVDIKAKFTKSSMVFVPIAGIDGKIEGKYDGIETIGDTISFFKDGRPRNNSYVMNSAVQSFVSSFFYVNLKEKQANYINYANSVSLNKSNPTQTEQFIINERKYSRYVRNTYLDLPGDIGELKDMAHVATHTYSHDFDKALAVERYLKSNFKYSLTASTTTNSALERIKHVIEQSKEGYCTYYASAMTLMMRQLGIPARYVVGYYSSVKEDDGSQHFVRSILDKNYHAWVEVYFEGIGWLTFDPTPGYGNNAPIRDYDYLDKEGPSDNPDQAPEQEQQQQQNVTEVPPHIKEVIELVPDAASDPMEKVIIALIYALIGVLLVLALIFGLKSINFRYDKMFKNLRTVNKTIMVRKIYPKIIFLLHGLGYDVQSGEIIQDYAKRIDKSLKLDISLISVIDDLEKSHFSENEISIEKAKEIFEYLKSLSDLSMKRFNIFKRIIYKVRLAK